MNKQQRKVRLTMMLMQNNYSIKDAQIIKEDIRTIDYGFAIGVGRVSIDREIMDSFAGDLECVDGAHNCGFYEDKGNTYFVVMKDAKESSTTGPRKRAILPRDDHESVSNLRCRFR